MKPGIAVTTTPNRKHIFDQWYIEYLRHVSDVYLYINNDVNYEGVAVSKNRCIANLYDAGVTDLFLFDDDLIIQSPTFINAYINSGFNHACWNYNRERIRFGIFATNNYDFSKPKIREFVEYDKPNGCLMYARRNVIDVVGGLDTSFVGYGFDHPNWSDRIFNNELTPARYIDIPNSHNLFKMAECESSFSYQTKIETIPINQARYKEKYYSKEFIPYK